MKSPWSRRRFVASAMSMVAAPALRGEAAAENAPLTLRCSLETTPSHMRNAIIRDYLGRIEAASGGHCCFGNSRRRRLTTLKAVLMMKIWSRVISRHITVGWIRMWSKLRVSLYAISATLPKFRLGILRSKDAKPGTNEVPFVNGEPPRLVGAPR
jgi:hypothetical protein